MSEAEPTLSDSRTQVGRKWSISRRLTAAALAGYLVIYLAYLGFVRDDWNHYVNMRDLHASQSVPSAVWSIATNDWFGAHELRIFFGSFLTHYLVSPLGEHASLVVYGIQGTMHVASAILAGWIIWRLLRSELAAIVTTLLLTFAPTVAQPALWINNLFFIQPWFLFCATVALMFVNRRSLLWSSAIALVAIACQFSGEPTLPLLYGALLLYAVTRLRKKDPWRVRVWGLLPIVASTLALAIYMTKIVIRPVGRGMRLPDWQAVIAYGSGVRDQFLAVSDMTSAEYGQGSVMPSFITLVVAALLCALAVTSVVLASGAIQASRKEQVRLLVVLGIGLLLTLVPMLFGMTTGARPGPDLRYLYVPSQLLYVLIVAVVLVVGQAIGPRSGRTVKAVLSILVVYAVCASVFNIIDVWAEQRRIDGAIWQRVDLSLSSSTRAIVTFNPNHQYLMAPYHSNAVSDFQADWGVAGRIAWQNPDWNRVEVFRDAVRLPSGDLAMRGYYGDSTSCYREAESPGDVIYMTYDYGPTFGDLSSSPLLVTTTFSEYEKSRDEILARHPEAARWASDSIQKACATP